MCGDDSNKKLITMATVGGAAYWMTGSMTTAVVCGGAVWVACYFNNMAPASGIPASV